MSNLSRGNKHLSEKEILQRLVFLAKALLSGWDQTSKGGIELLKLLLKQIAEIIHKKVRPQNSYKSRLTDKIRGLAGETPLSLAGEVLEIMARSHRQWLNNPEIETFTHCEDVINNVLKRKRSEQWQQRQTTTPNNTFLDWQIAKFYKKNERDLPDLEKSIIDVFSPATKESQKKCKAINEIKRNYEILISVAEKIGAVHGKTLDVNRRQVFNNKIKSFKKEIKKEFSEDLHGRLLNLTEGKSVYQIAKERGLDFKKLLYLLRFIKFPLRKFGGNNLIEKNRLSLFESLYPDINLYFLKVDSYRKWIRLFKSMGWEKSRISKFMSRRIKSGVVPPWFFEMVPPVKNSKTLLNRLIRSDRRLNGFFLELQLMIKQQYKISDENDINLWNTFKDMRKELLRIVEKSN